MTMTSTEFIQYLFYINLEGPDEKGPDSKEPGEERQGVEVPVPGAGDEIQKDQMIGSYKRKMVDMGCTRAAKT